MKMKMSPGAAAAPQMHLAAAGGCDCCDADGDGGDDDGNCRCCWRCRREFCACTRDRRLEKGGGERRTVGCAAFLYTEAPASETMPRSACNHALLLRERRCVVVPRNQTEEEERRGEKPEKFQDKKQ